MTLGKYKFKKNLYILFFCFLAMTPLSNFPEKEGLSFGETIFWYGSTVLVDYITLWLLLFFTEGVTMKKGPDRAYVEIGIWGYLWRHFLAFALSAVLFAVSAVLIPAFKGYFFMMPLTLFYYLILTYLFFCRNKKEKRQEIMVFLSHLSI